MGILLGFYLVLVVWFCVVFWVFFVVLWVFGVFCCCFCLLLIWFVFWFGFNFYWYLGFTIAGFFFGGGVCSFLVCTLPSACQGKLPFATAPNNNLIPFLHSDTETIFSIPPLY